MFIKYLQKSLKSHQANNGVNEPQKVFNCSFHWFVKTFLVLLSKYLVFGVDCKAKGANLLI